MHVLPPYHRVLLLTEGQLGVFTSKTAAVVLRYRPHDVVALVDSQAAGSDLRAAIPWAPPLPVLRDVSAAAPLQPDALFVGVAPVGGALPLDMRRHIKAALTSGIDVVSGLHTHLGNDEELAALAKQSGARIADLRRPPPRQLVASGRALGTRCRRVLTVGTDCNVGKMVAAVELVSCASRRGLNAQLAATGQGGIMIAGQGIAMDAVIIDFAAGAVEELVLASTDCDLCVIEGQGSVAHPGYSGVALALLHGACPDALILVHHAGRTHHKAEPHLPIPSLRVLCAAYEQAAALLHPTRIVGVALNAHGTDRQAAQQEAARIRQELGVPVVDPLHEGCEPLLAAVLAD
ncbi:MAG: DUF1611 domain-containing protein [Planctomycetes bacterium]|nr:DUF1611 domain-containing protein [Planctomycetota bacterium]